MSVLETLRGRLPRNWQAWLNAYIALNFAGYAAWRLAPAYAAGTLTLAEFSFAAQTLLLCVVILIRREHKSVEPSLPRQALALAAFFSGLLMIGEAPTTCAAALSVSAYITFAANFLGVLTVLNLGRSFGILIALREVRTYGLYGLVRHPMYATDILLRAGYLVGHPTWRAAAVTILSALAYYWRARFEEEFLSRDPGYRDYMLRVRARFIPFVF